VSIAVLAIVACVLSQGATVTSEALKRNAARIINDARRFIAECEFAMSVFRGQGISVRVHFDVA
jgi:hypothetical protein